MDHEGIKKMTVTEYKAMVDKKRSPTHMNKTEAAYGGYLEMLRRAGPVLWYGYEPVTFKLAVDTRYTPDFMVVLADGTVECHEVKGFMRDDANVKIKVAADKFPFRFFVVRKSGRGWEVQQIQSGGGHEMYENGVAASCNGGGNQKRTETGGSVGCHARSRAECGGACCQNWVLGGHNPPAEK